MAYISKYLDTCLHAHQILAFVGIRHWAPARAPARHWHPEPHLIWTSTWIRIYTALPRASASPVRTPEEERVPESFLVLFWSGVALYVPRGTCIHSLLARIYIPPRAGEKHPSTNPTHEVDRYLAIGCPPCTPAREISHFPPLQRARITC